MKTVPENERWLVPNENSILTDLWAESQKLVANAHTNYPHRGGRGDHRETLLRELLIAQLPQSFAACKGHVQDSDGQQTSEIDILLYDPNYRMVIAKAAQDKLVLPVESVLAAIEIRTRIDTSALDDVDAKICELANLNRYYSDLGMAMPAAPGQPIAVGARQLGPCGSVVPIPVFLLGFESVSAATVGAKWDTCEYNPDLVACLGEYSIIRLSPPDDSILIEAPHTELASIMLQLTAHLLFSKRCRAVPDLLKYFRVVDSDNRPVLIH